MNHLRKVFFSTTALVFIGSAYGQETDTLEDRITALEAMVMELKQELAAERAENATKHDKTGKDIIRIETTTKKALSASKEADGFRIGNTSFKIGGYIDLDTHVTTLSDGAITSNSIARDFYIPSATPIGGDSTTTLDGTAQASRLSFTAQRKHNGKSLTGYFELDFLGSSQGNELVSSSFSPRLRRAYIDYGNWRVGQEWTTFQNLSAIPESTSFLALSDGMIFGRQALVRYTHGNWQFAVENPNTTTLNIGSKDDNTLPDLIGRYNMKGNFGNISFSAIARQLKADTGETDSDTFGWGISAAGRIKVGEKNDIRFSLSGGEGLGRYIGLAASRATALDPDGDLEAISSYGGLIAYRHPFGETARFNIGYSGLWVDNPEYLGGMATESVQSAYGAILWDIAPKLTLGVELLSGIRNLEDDSDGSMTRFTFSTKYAF